MLLALTALLQQPNPHVTAKQFPATKRPILNVPGLNPADILAVSSYATPEQPHPTYVYRYCFKGDATAVFHKFKAQLVKKGGWNLETYPDKAYSLTKIFSAGPVEVQALLFHKGRLIPDSNGGHTAQGSESQKWVWISYNERPRPKP